MSAGSRRREIRLRPAQVLSLGQKLGKSMVANRSLFDDNGSGRALDVGNPTATECCYALPTTMSRNGCKRAHSEVVMPERISNTRSVPSGTLGGRSSDSWNPRLA